MRDSIDVTAARVFVCVCILLANPDETGVQIILILPGEAGMQIKSAYFSRLPRKAKY